MSHDTAEHATPVELRARRAEPELWRRFHARGGIRGAVVGDGIALAGPGPISYAMGVDGPDAPAGIVETICAYYASTALPASVEVTPYASRAFLEALAQRRFGIVRWSNLLVRGLVERHTAGPPNDDVAVRRVSEDERALWCDAARRGFEAGDDQAAVFEVCFDAADHRYVAEVDGEVVGAACIALVDGVALLATGCALPSARGRGVHRALLRARLLDAAANGCDVAALKAEPGGGSERNALRAGFRVAFSMPVFSAP